MAAPTHIPQTGGVSRPHSYTSPPRRAGSWVAARPGDFEGGQPHGPGLGTQGPDQGYALTLTRRLVDGLSLAPGETLGDVVPGLAAVAMQRASLFGRAPVVHDVRVAARLFGFVGSAPDDLVRIRKERFAGLGGHHPGPGLVRLCESIPASTLRMTPSEIESRHSGGWSALIGA